MNRLIHHVAVVTGSTSGIGQAIAKTFIAEGATVCLVGRNAEKLKQLETQLGPNAHGFTADIGDESQLGNLARTILSQFLKINILVHAAGVFEGETIMAVNVTAPKQLTTELLSNMSDGGDIVFLNSSAIRNTTSEDSYIKSKIALKEYADALRSQVNEKSIRVLSVYPGRTATPMQEQVFKNEQREYHAELLLQPEDIASSILSAITLPKTAEVTDLHIRPFKKY